MYEWPRVEVGIRQLARSPGGMRSIKRSVLVLAGLSKHATPMERVDDGPFADVGERVAVGMCPRGSPRPRI